MPTDIESTKQEVRQSYNDDTLAARYLTRYRGHKALYFKKLENDIVLSLCNVKDKKVLDLGTGTGRLALDLAPSAEFVVGADLAEAMVMQGEREARTLGKPENVQFVVDDAMNMSFRDHSFDICVSLGLFEWVDDMEPFLNEIARVTRPGGTIVFSVHLRRPGGKKARRSFYRAYHSIEKVMEQLEKSGFTYLSHKGTFFISPRIVWAIHKLFVPFRGPWIRLVIKLQSLIRKTALFLGISEDNIAYELIVAARRN